MRHFFLWSLALLILTGCSSMSGQQYLNQEPAFNLQNFFTGEIKAWGIVQDRKGNVINRFDVDMIGTWDGNEGKLVEDFLYYNGDEQQRIWYITNDGNGNYTGRADDIVGEADGMTFGNAGNWKYIMDVPVEDKTYRMTLDDWFWMMNDNVLMNRSYMKKFGITFAEITIFMQKID